jgi:hypothetical protein
MLKGTLLRDAAVYWYLKLYRQHHRNITTTVPHQYNVDTRTLRVTRPTSDNHYRNWSSSIQCGFDCRGQLQLAFDGESHPDAFISTCLLLPFNVPSYGMDVIKVRYLG